MLALIKRYRELFAIGVLLVLPLVTYLAWAKDGRDLNAVDRGVILVTTPIERGISRVLGKSIELWNGYLSLREAHQENLGLQRQNAELRGTVARLIEAQAENDRLRRMIGFAETAPTPLLTAPIIGEAPVMNLLTFKIGKGTADGVSKGMPVVCSDGIIGRVLSAGLHSADVLLMADTNFAVPVRVQRSRARAKVMGQGARERPSLVQALRTDDVEDGDILITAGTDDVFPKGLMVGRVTNVVRANHGMFLKAEVVPAADIAKVEEVFVLMGLPGRGDFPEASLPRP
ncbi:MAG: rod shape-determining protein MreC [Deltaproteobacteria bacterium]|nr:rod shape-determining protein MreC [Deltaproteobacteria bacterium]